MKKIISVSMSVIILISQTQMAFAGGEDDFVPKRSYGISSKARRAQKRDTIWKKENPETYRKNLSEFLQKKTENKQGPSVAQPFTFTQKLVLGLGAMACVQGVGPASVLGAPAANSLGMLSDVTRDLSRGGISNLALDQLRIEKNRLDLENSDQWEHRFTIDRAIETATYVDVCTKNGGSSLNCEADAERKLKEKDSKIDRCSRFGDQSFSKHKLYFNCNRVVGPIQNEVVPPPAPPVKECPVLPAQTSETCKSASSEVPFGAPQNNASEVPAKVPGVETTQNSEKGPEISHQNTTDSTALVEFHGRSESSSSSASQDSPSGESCVSYGALAGGLTVAAGLSAGITYGIIKKCQKRRGRPPGSVNRNNNGEGQGPQNPQGGGGRGRGDRAERGRQNPQGNPQVIINGNVEGNLRVVGGDYGQHSLRHNQQNNYNAAPNLPRGPAIPPGPGPVGWNPPEAQAALGANPGRGVGNARGGNANLARRNAALPAPAAPAAQGANPGGRGGNPPVVPAPEERNGPAVREGLRPRDNNGRVAHRRL